MYEDGDGCTGYICCDIIFILYWWCICSGWLKEELIVMRMGVFVGDDIVISGGGLG